MPDLILRLNLSPPTFATNIVLNALIPDTVLPSQSGDIFWRWEDEPEMQPLYLTSGNAGETVEVPFELKGRSIRLFLAYKSTDGQRRVTDYSKMSQTVFNPSPKPELDYQVFEVTEDVAAGALVDIFDDSGTSKIRKANATDDTKLADAFVNEAYTTGQMGTAYFGGNKITSLTGLIPGKIYFLSTTGGQITDTAPSGSGNVQQQVGVATTDTTLQFEPQPRIKLR